MFDNISSLKFQAGSSNETQATAMISSEGEVMNFRQVIATEGRVEDWMTNVLNEMRRTNRLITKEAIYKYCDEMERFVERCNYRKNSNKRLFNFATLNVGAYSKVGAYSNFHYFELHGQDTFFLESNKAKDKEFISL